MRRDPREVEERSPLPLRATAIVLAMWITGLVLLAFVIVPLVFATCVGPTPGVQ
ncbi:MAG TPA: hypothetical protein VIN70_02275 [Candidatus Limnocylindria bacterium]